MDRPRALRLGAVATSIGSVSHPPLPAREVTHGGSIAQCSEHGQRRTRFNLVVPKFFGNRFTDVALNRIRQPNPMRHLLFPILPGFFSSSELSRAPSAILFGKNSSKEALMATPTIEGDGSRHAFDPLSCGPVLPFPCCVWNVRVSLASFLESTNQRLN